jgi:hypothetical protein
MLYVCYSEQMLLKIRTYVWYNLGIEEVFGVDVVMLTYAAPRSTLSWYKEVIREEQQSYFKNKAVIPHDEAFKKLLQTFFAEFIALFFPELDALLDHSHTRLLMQELLVDVVGEKARKLDLLLETRYKGLDACVLVHLEPQSYKDQNSRSACSSTSVGYSNDTGRSIN